MKELKYADKRILLGDAVMRLQNQTRDNHDGHVQCIVCGEWTEKDDSQKANVQGELIEIPQAGNLCENCLDNLRYVIIDMEEKLEKDGHY